MIGVPIANRNRLENITCCSSEECCALLLVGGKMGSGTMPMWKSSIDLLWVAAELVDCEDVFTVEKVDSPSK